MKGKDLIKYIQDNKLEDALVTVTATMYYNGDHDCRTTSDVSVYKSCYGGEQTIDFYVDSSLY